MREPVRWNKWSYYHRCRKYNRKWYSAGIKGDINKAEYLFQLRLHYANMMML